jgi:diguanylate cyclase (GGDEF)-like protein
MRSVMASQRYLATDPETESHAGRAAVLANLLAVLERLEHGILLLQDGVAVGVTGAMGSLLGVPADKLVGCTADQLSARIQGLVDEQPPRVRDGRLFAREGGIFCEEFELARPRRSVVRWVTHCLVIPLGELQMVTCTDITADVDLGHESQRLATTDFLTGLRNRMSVELALAQQVLRARHEEQPLCVMLIDVDHFKKINDDFGHLVGDEALRQVAKVISDQLRQSDMVGRWGGEEFIAVLPNTPMMYATRVAERVRAAIEANVVIENRPVTISVGVAEIGEMADGDALIAGADDRLYQAKADGRNCVR